MVHLNMTNDPTPKEGLIRHMVLNSIRAYRTKFKDKYGEIVICCDDKNYWRKQIFPYYKQNRKGDRKKSPHDWNEIFTALDRTKTELKEFFPYKVVQVESAEADDVIAAICHKYGTEEVSLLGTSEPILIISGDKDLTQLQLYSNVENYSPMTKKYIKINDPLKSLHEHIMRGDRSDGIPNFLSEDGSFMEGGRQKPIRTKKIEVWLDLQPKDFCDERMLRNYKRNELLIDLSKIPESIANQSVEIFETAPHGDRSKLLNYFISKGLNKLMDSLQEF